ncbi:MAG: alpha/beta hydrolase-fold protein [Sutterellaceae bacterium]|nr:alpha/beta hydrolase-fold protein [Sutterellaceae bacterium]MDY2869084.1 alpha/beta hydrolase-fold protein [Mesosutterella sp.]
MGLQEMVERRTRFAAGGKEATLYPARNASAPLVVLNVYDGDGSGVHQALRAIGSPDCSLLAVGELAWDRDLSPWASPAVMKGERPFEGGADAYLEELLSEIIPEAEKRLSGTPVFRVIAGYSLAGLFALYSLCRTGEFSGAACASGSFWFPGAREFFLSHEFVRAPGKLYFSLGDREAATRNPVLGTVQENTEALVSHYRDLGVRVRWELNPGNHFRDPSLRTAKGIAAVL